MSYASVKALGRARMQEVRMDSRCTVWRNTNRRVQDDDTDYEGWEYASEHGDLPMRLKPGTSERVVIGDVEQERGLAECHFPALTDNLRDGDLVEITRGESVGAWYRVIDATPADGRTARRVRARSIDKPEDFVEAP